MNQLDLFITDFEVTTIEQLISYRVSRGKGETDEQLSDRIEKLCRSPKIEKEAREMVLRWNTERISKGLKPW